MMLLLGKESVPEGASYFIVLIYCGASQYQPMGVYRHVLLLATFWKTGGVSGAEMDAFQAM